MPSLILELELVEEVIHLKSIPYVKLFVKELLHSIRNLLMNNLKEILKKFYLHMTDHCWLLILEDVNQRNSVVQELEQENKNHIDEII